MYFPKILLGAVEDVEKCESPYGRPENDEQSVTVNTHCSPEALQHTTERIVVVHSVEIKWRGDR